MGEEFYCVLKLVSGEEVFALISIDENNDDPIVIMQNPVIIKIGSNQMGTFIKIKPWMEIPSDNIFIIRNDKIITMSEVSDENMISIYQKYIQDDDGDDNISLLNKVNSDSNKVDISDNMGYLSSVEEARKKLENIFNNKDIKD
jgi:hypothetical protein